MSQPSRRPLQRTLSQSSRESSTGSSSTKAPASGSSQSSAPKKMSSLSSLQTFHFKAPRSSSQSKADQDRILMPPPSKSRSTSPVKLSTKPVSSGSTSSQKSAPAPKTGSKSSSSNGRKGKGKENDVIELLSSDEEIDEIRLASPVRTVGKRKRKEETGIGTSQMWTELYCPTAESDLAPGKARVQKIKGWLHEALFGYPPEVTKPPPPYLRDKLRKYRRILFLTGPAGAGKTTTLKLLAQQMDIDVDEWGEGVEEWGVGTVGETERESSISKFASFIDRDTSSLSLSSSRTATPQKKARARIILLTALPNLSHPKTMEGFHASLLRFCQRFSTNSCPMVIIHSDAGQSGRAEESWMDATRDRGGRERGLEILGKDIKDGACFIPIAPTFMFKALSRILTLSPLPTASHPAKATLQLICQSSNGDLRAAINSLQMFCGGRGKIPNGRGAARGQGKGRGQKDEGHVVVKRKGKGSMGGKGGLLDVSPELRAVLDAVTRKEQSLNLFHALGKVFYNKRLGDPNQQEDENQETLEMIRQLPKDDDLPSHLKEFTRRKSLVQMETFIPSIPLDASSFALWVHQSLPSFCEEIEQVSQGLDYLVESDAMRTDDDIWQSQPQTIQYALQLTLRGAAMSLPSPVPRGKAAHHKIVKPAFFSEWKKERESLGALESAGRYLERRGVKASNGSAGGTWGGLLSRKEMICEMVPMLIKIQNLSGQPLLPVSAQPVTLPNWTPVRASAPSSQSSQSRFTQSADELTAKSELAIEDESLEGVLGDWDEVPGHVVNEEAVTEGEEPKQGVWDDDGIRNDGEEEAQFIEDDDIVDDWD
ncbi:hypothetical protein I350_01446 [Cryptococcus amylolentus CBS 6273]|uniref:AAA+ ATPase domain-containing protein n=1 Tax=Cryptococcus amylolentus CBS 6273 TaxID=1296118 RepID=A0A1E3KE31_9TREE|nr:hypothetical protein I350_01446 [Cryptococcus amylolentus CBS 6273]